ncbi:hypothetical protein [Cardinium endosymbiont of Philonthus spinipes]|uniref:hypothetical protein n=1 Tax=Cardinium endosymbiont of Philonthus spinipes TaxID=3077941 RepID=UPI00313F3A6B
MKINMRFVCLSGLTSLLSFISCNRFNLGQRNMDGNAHGKNTGCSSDDTSNQPIAKFINDFTENIGKHFKELIRLNKEQASNDNHLVRQLYHLFSSNYLNYIFKQDKTIQSSGRDDNQETYNSLRDKLCDKVNPNLEAKHVVPKQYWEATYQHPYDAEPPNNHNELIKELGKVVLNSIKEQIIDQSPYVMKKSKKAIEKFIALRFKYNKKYLKKNNIRAGETSIGECLQGFYRLKSKYYDSIQIKGDELLTCMEQEIRSLIEKGPAQKKCNRGLTFIQNKLASLRKKDPIQKKNDLAVQSVEKDINPIKKNINKLIHTMYIYNGCRLLFYFDLCYKGITLPKTDIKVSRLKGKLRSYISMMLPHNSKIIRSTSNLKDIKAYADMAIHRIDLYTALINIGIEKDTVLREYTRLLEDFKNNLKF